MGRGVCRILGKGARRGPGGLSLWGRPRWAMLGVKWERRCQRGCSDALSAAIALGEITPEWGTREPRGSPGALPVLSRCSLPHRGPPDVAAFKFIERIRYKNRDTARVRAMPGIPDPALPSPVRGGTAGKPLGRGTLVPLRASGALSPYRAHGPFDGLSPTRLHSSRGIRPLILRGLEKDRPIPKGSLCPLTAPSRHSLTPAEFQRGRCGSTRPRGSPDPSR